MRAWLPYIYRPMVKEAMRALTLIPAIGLALAAWLGGGEASEAASLTFNIEGTFTDAFGAFSGLGIAFSGDHISGSFAKPVLGPTAP